MKIQYCSLMVAIVVMAGCQRTNAPATTSESGDNNADDQRAIPVAHAEPADLVDLRLKVQAGDRFPLIKTVEQSVSQQSSTDTASAVTRLQLSLVLTVEEVIEDSIVFNVRYSRIHYAHNVDGHQSVYDSSSPTETIPVDAVPYAGLPGNDYSLRIGPDHRVQELIGHDEFLERCMAGVPVARRATLMNEIAVRFGDDGVAGFVPDTIGLLPFDRKATSELACRVQEGDSWNYERQLMQPIPVNLKSTCRVIRVTPDSTEIDIAGRVTPGTTYSDDASSGGAAVRILGGTTSGTCIVDRRTGLPMDVERRELLNVQVIAPDGTKISQEKRIATTVRLFPEERGTVVGTPRRDSQIIPVSAEGPNKDPRARTIPTTVR